MSLKGVRNLLFFAILAGSSLLGDEDSGRRIRLGGISVGASYSHGPWSPYYSPYRYYYGPWGLYDPFWYSPFIHPALYGGYGYQPSTGEIKLDTDAKDASVYLDGAFAGTVESLKNFRLEPGAYNLELRDSNQATFSKRIYVLSGKTLRLRPRLERQP
jgi:hypothetical protein